jgi:anti-sigma factor RsiW
MRCNELDAALASYLRGELDSARTLALETHAAACERCERLLDARTTVPLRPLAVEPPAEVRSVVLATIRDARRRGRWRRLGGAAAVAAAAVVVLVSWPAQKEATNIPGEMSVDMAAERARPEFAALDEAARELEAALRAAPDDRDLQAFLATVNERRAALARLIQDAAS